MSSSNSQQAAENAAQQIEQLLAKSMGPMAKIVLARARKKGGDDQALLQILAHSIENEAERAAFLSAAARVLSSLRKSGVTSALAFAREASAENTGIAATTQTGAVTRVRDDTTELRSAARDDDIMQPGAIFVSYARDNLPVAQRLADALREAGLQVWLDLGKLQAGDAWNLKIRRNIDACSFFMALISRETDARPEGYFRREWNIAADRALNFADDVPFLLPVTIDDTAAYSARVPERFRSAHWTALPGGEMTAEFLERLKELVSEYRRLHPAA